MHKFKGVALGLALGLLSGASAQAATVVLDAGKMDQARTVTIAGLGNVLAAPMQFKTVYDGEPQTLLAWCVDVYHQISAKDYAPDLKYVDTEALTTDFAGKALDAGDTTKVGLLANYGQYLFDTTPVSPGTFTQVAPKRSNYPAGAAGTAAYNAALSSYNGAKSSHNAALASYNAAVSARYTRLSAVQGAIWQVVSNRNVYSNDAAFDLLVDNLSSSPTAHFVAGFTARDRGFDLITPVQTYGGKTGKTPLPLTQSFVYATGAVPEPGTWALMIVGFGFAGSLLRRRSPTAQPI